MAKTKFIMINNQLITEGNEHQLNSEELYLYSILQMSKDLNDEIYFTVTLLNDKSTIQLGSSKQRAVKKIKENLCSLVEKKVIKITNILGEVLTDMKPNDVVIAQVLKIEENGFTKLSLDIFYYIKKVEYIYIYLATHRWANSGDGCFTCSYDRWASILQCSKRHAIELINEAVEKSIIYKNIGDYDNKNNNKKQDINKYRTFRFSKDEKTKHTKKEDEYKMKKILENQSVKISTKSILEDIELNTDLVYFEIEDLERSYFRFSDTKNEFGRDQFPEVEDYVLLHDLNKDKNLRQLTEFEVEVFNAGSKRMKMLENKSTSKKIMMEKIGKAKEIIKNREKSQQKEIGVSNRNDSDDDPFGED
ncbi:hypothetical protein [Ureibacillus aquaedulcis]|uniref:Uncharacterized protein n=1 Tax=Ureibacillus aquaedulcis TaxID=3058421 RepID=A0ABT8GUB3_9BACL|nr:hypothetical protein [Ureibacillus sp. BA0131]MDN4494926.1 hypothetical protein [Ureibacillus sp. BA0131]